METMKTRTMGIRVALTLGAVMLLQCAWRPVAVQAAVAVQDLQSVKGFVTAKAARSLTVLVGGRLTMVALTERTRVLGQRAAFTEIVPNDIVRVEGRTIGRNRILAERIEVVLASGTLRVQSDPDAQTVDLITVKF